ncbi:TetR/AcrR family transcriptional regulator [Adhaeribacter rhizoryzae]|uniref:TetR/AcrR family transcriptional regulator n=1 Tax=Adhaeribacter rhizoryzae TaxID=2607907 RepID=A0A5M6DGV2_9BACT|nr:TetR/AcrR family transcriptional regulator [Adhaeribacter rhizoryzae]KAA5546643.1 TetR/AcrR family transcriptional regulator [Adhaeribacter rhizoryzae]
MDTNTVVKERILKQAFELFKKYGIKTISMDDIALNLGMSKKTIYRWFENKDQLVEEALTTYLNEIKIECTPSNSNAIEEFCLELNNIIKKLLQFHTSFFYDLKKYHNQAYLIWQSYKQQHIIQHLKANLAQGISAGLYRPDVDADITARLYTGQLETIFDSELFPAGKFNLQETYRQTLKNFIMGVASAEGHKILDYLCQQHCPDNLKYAGDS